MICAHAVGFDEYMVRIVKDEVDARPVSRRLSKLKLVHKYRFSQAGLIGIIAASELPLNEILFSHSQEERMPGNYFGSNDRTIPVDLTFDFDSALDVSSASKIVVCADAYNSPWSDLFRSTQRWCPEADPNKQQKRS